MSVRFKAKFKSYAGADLILEKGEATFCIKYLPFHSAKKLVNISEDTVYLSGKSTLTKDHGYWKKRYAVASSKATELPIEKHSLKHSIYHGFDTRETC